MNRQPMASRHLVMKARLPEHKSTRDVIIGKVHVFSVCSGRGLHVIQDSYHRPPKSENFIALNFSV